jgi:protein ImuA
MQLISCHDGKLLTLDAHSLRGGRLEAGGLSSATGNDNGVSDRAFITGLPALDALPPGGALARGAVHEILSEESHGTPLFLAMILAKSSMGPCGTGILPVSSTFPNSNTAFSPITLRHGQDARATIWCDPNGTLYPPALAAYGIPLERLFLLHPRAAADQTWAAAECLRCRGVAAVVATIDYRLSRVEARRLQLSAERGGGVGLLLRPADRAVSSEHAAVTRWLVRPVPGERTVQRWSVQLIHGHGGRVGQAVILEHSRETNRVRAVEELANRAVEKEVARPRDGGGFRRVPA